MIKKLKLIVILLLVKSIGLTQSKYTDSLIQQLALAKEDTSRALIMADLCFYYSRSSNIESSLLYGQKALALSRQIKFLRGEADASYKMGATLRQMGDLPESLELHIQGLKIAEDNNYIVETDNILRGIALIYIQLQDYQEALSYLHEAMKTHKLMQDKRGKALDYMNLGLVYAETNKLDLASHYEQQAFSQMKYIEFLAPEVYRILGYIETKKTNYQKAVVLYNDGIESGLKINDSRTISLIYADMARMFRQLNQRDLSISAAKNGLEYGKRAFYKNGIFLSSSLLSELYDSTDAKEALRYYKMSSAAKDSLFGAGNIQTMQELISKENARQKEVEAAKTAYQNRLKQYSLLAGLGVFLIIVLVLYRNNKQKQKANQVLEATLTNLKSTQAQLVHSEKMASLGELTAGIAHEIQNPLNFVNNFSEVNEELISELVNEVDKGNTEEVKAIANDIKQNLEKINHHGRRADGIVKGMLQHSKTSTGVKEPTDINKLANEYLRLAYHGMRAKDKSFNAEIKTELDESIDKINLVPQDMGRVLLNLFNNAFYAVNEKKKSYELSAMNYQPLVSVQTKHITPPQGMGAKIEIIVKDNGNGIPHNVIGKIFNPFFTTKPTGQGTGLGLSLSYDIIKAHGGELKVETKEGEGAEFIIRLHA